MRRRLRPRRGAASFDSFDAATRFENTPVDDWCPDWSSFRAAGREPDLDAGGLTGWLNATVAGGYACFAPMYDLKR